jgi:hypothetical protein
MMKFGKFILTNPAPSAVSHQRVYNASSKNVKSKGNIYGEYDTWNVVSFDHMMILKFFNVILLVYRGGLHAAMIAARQSGGYLKMVNPELLRDEVTQVDDTNYNIVLSVNMAKAASGTRKLILRNLL